MLESGEKGKEKKWETRRGRRKTREGNNRAVDISGRRIPQREGGRHKGQLGGFIGQREKEKEREFAWDFPLLFLHSFIRVGRRGRHFKSLQLASLLQGKTEEEDGGKDQKGAREGGRAGDKTAPSSTSFLSLPISPFRFSHPFQVRLLSFVFSVFFFLRLEVGGEERENDDEIGAFLDQKRGEKEEEREREREKKSISISFPFLAIPGSESRGTPS